MFWALNKALLPMKAHYFMFNAGTGPVQPFLSIYARQLGFSAVVVGLIYTILPIFGMLAKPLLGGVADRFKCQKQIFLGAQLLTAVAFLAINFSPEIPVEREVHFACEGEAVFDTSPNHNAEVDNCFIEQMQKESGTINCDLNCPMEQQFWDVIINSWKVQGYAPPYPDNFKFTAGVNKSKTLNFESVVYFTVKNVTVDGRVYNPVCSSDTISTICSIDCIDYNLDDLITKQLFTDQEVYSKSQFWIFLLLMIAGWIGQAVTVSIGDAICFELLGEHNRYGYQRMFGSMGWGIFSVIAGVMVDSLSDGTSKKNYESAFYMSFAFLLLDFAVSCKLTHKQQKHSQNILKDVGRLLTDIHIDVFLVWCIGVGMCTGLIWQFLFFLIEDLAKNQGCDSQQWIKTLEGLVMAIETLLGEMPFFFLSGRILKRIGHIYSMSLILLVIGIRYILYSVIPNPWWFLPVELLQGFTFGLFYACMASYASIIAPPGTEATMQGLVGAVFEGVGVSLGSFVGGVLYEAYGGPWTFRLFGIGALITCLLHAAVQYLLKRSDLDEVKYVSPPTALSALCDDLQELPLVG